ncbi:MAG: amidase [Rhizobiaceae bacterium]
MQKQRKATTPAVAARDRLLEVQDKLGLCTEILSGIVEVEARHREDLASAGCVLGPLHGLPIVVKDIIDVAGSPTRAGSQYLDTAQPATSDAFVVAKLRAAGAVTVAKTSTVEFAFGGWGTNASLGTPRNPWKPDDQHTPGGSSSGTGVAVGGKFVPAGLGTDTGGSVRVPAAFCGCVGLKTSTGMVGRTGVIPLSDTFDTIGPLTDTVQRAADMLQAMMGEDPADSTTIGVVRTQPLKELERGVAGLRLGVIPDEALKDASTDVLAAFHLALKILEDAGAQMVPVSLPKDFVTYQRLSTAFISSDAYTFHADMVESKTSAINDATRARMLAHRDMSGRDRIIAQRNRTIDIAEYLEAMDRLDAVLLPTAPTTAIPLADVDENDYSVSLYTRAANYLDLAALTVPIGLSAEGLPTALQIMTRRFDDALALRIGFAFEQARGIFPLPPSPDA